MGWFLSSTPTSTEIIEDDVAALVDNSASITWTYDDAGNSLSAEVNPAGVDHGALGGLSDDDHVQYFKVTGRTNESLQLTGAANLNWGTDGGGLVGSQTANRPAQMFIAANNGQGGLAFSIGRQYGTSGTNTAFAIFAGPQQSGGAQLIGTDAGGSGNSSMSFTTTGFTFERGGDPRVEVSGNTLIMRKSTGANMLWSTDGGGNVGEVVAGVGKRPGVLYSKSTGTANLGLAIGRAYAGGEAAVGTGFAVFAGASQPVVQLIGFHNNSSDYSTFEFTSTGFSFDFPGLAHPFQMVNKDFLITNAGGGLKIKEGSNAKLGTATLVAGSVTVANTVVTANSRIFVTINSPAGVVGSLYVNNIAAGTSFDIVSTSVADVSTVAWMIVEPV